METLFNFLGSIFALRARQGWILALACGFSLTLNHFSVAPFASMDVAWVLALGIGFVAGITILLVCLVEWLIRSRREMIMRGDYVRKQIQKHDAREREAVDNLPLLNRDERIALAYIFTQNSQRFRGEAGYNVLSSLAAKEIIGVPANSNAHDVLLVRDSVWKLRHDLLKEWEGHIFIPNRAPWEPW